MSVVNGQDVSAEITNSAFMSRNSNTDTVGSVGLLKPTGSGSLIIDLQKTINNIITSLGVANQDALLLDFTGTTYLTDATAKAALEQLDSALNGIFSSTNTWTGSNSFTGFLNVGSQNNAQSGSNVTITGVTTTVTRLTNAALASISGITAPSGSRLFIFENKSGFPITIKDNDTVNALAADIIRTGSDTDIDLESNAAIMLFYDLTSSEWHILGGTGSGTGILVVADLTERNAIVTGDRYDGLLVYVVSEQKNYQLIGGITNSDWKELGFLTTFTNTATGADQTLAVPTTSILKTSATLTSIVGITATGSIKELVLVNTTGAVLTIRHESTSATAANRIYTGTGSDIYLQVDSAIYIYYDTTTQRWRVIGASPSNNPSYSSVLTLTAGGNLTASTTTTIQSFLVSGNTTAVTLSNTPFGATAPLNAAVLKIIGNDDTKTVTIPAIDTALGVYGYSVTLGKGQTATYEYNSTLNRYVILGVSN